MDDKYKVNISEFPDRFTVLGHRYVVNYRHEPTLITVTISQDDTRVEIWRKIWEAVYFTLGQDVILAYKSLDEFIEAMIAGQEITRQGNARRPI
jgi:hypothetical protein